MIFHSLDFIVFFLVTTAVYWMLPRRGQNLLLLAASYFFYGYIHTWFLSLIIVTTVADYWAARGMEAWPSQKKLMLGLSLVVNLGLLGFFKYFNFFAENVHVALSAVGLDFPKPLLNVVLPVGISFYTFQELSYTIGVYRGTIRARRDFIDFAAFVCFYPQLVAGPIERAAHLLPQIEQRRVWSSPAAESAAFLICWGYFKKLVIADNAGVIANKVFSLEAPGFYVVWAGVFAFAIQIYGDFSAYSDIARGVAKWLGFDLIRNFDHPYVSTGPADFWRRWHISLSSWFRDFVYIPLGGSRGPAWKTARNLMLTFLVSGFWHGASWNYVLWGAYHGGLLVAARLMPAVTLTPAARAILAPLRIVGMFLLVCIGWLIFRETDIHMLLRDLTLVPWEASESDWRIGSYLFILTAIYSVPLWIDDIWSVFIKPRLDARHPEWAAATPPLIARTALAGLAFAIILVFRSRQSLDFIYFQF